MRFFLLMFTGLVLSIFGLAACNSTESVKSQSPAPTSQTATPQTPSDNARRITARELHDLWEKGKVLVVDTRTEPAFKESHIKGAILIPAGEFANRVGELPRDKMIVTYCT